MREATQRPAKRQESYQRRECYPVQHQRLFV